MARTTLYCVQPYWRSGERLAAGAVQQLACERAARRAAARVASREAGALVYSLEGDPVFGTWSPPRLVAAFGEVPDIKF